MSSSFGSGLHAAPGRPVDAAAYDNYLGQWSRLLVPAVLAAAEVASGHRVLDISCGPGEASLMALPKVGPSGSVIGADIAPAMLVCARQRLNAPSFLAVAADGQALPFADGSFDAVVCQLGLMFFPDPVLGLREFRRVVRRGCCTAVCVNPTADRVPMWGILADVLSRVLPHQRAVFQSSFSLSDPERLQRMFAEAGFRDISVVREQREGVVESFDEYWQPIEAGTGSMPQAYVALPEQDRRAVREEVTARLARFASNGRLKMSVEMLIGRGRA
jgi:ubiquinone/menaquinone biosynthesis C-methylase UbiE